MYVCVCVGVDGFVAWCAWDFGVTEMRTRERLAREIRTRTRETTERYVRQSLERASERERESPREKKSPRERKRESEREKERV